MLPPSSQRPPDHTAAPHHTAAPDNEHEVHADKIIQEVDETVNRVRDFAREKLDSLDIQSLPKELKIKINELRSFLVKDPSDLWGASKAARYLGFSREWTIQLAKNGHVGSKVGDRYLFPKEDLEAFEKLDRHPGPPSRKTTLESISSSESPLERKPTEVITTKEAAVYLGISENDTLQLARNGTFGTLHGNRYFYPVAELDEFKKN